MLEEDDGVDETRALPSDTADLVPDESGSPESSASDDLDERLDEALEATFPASDPFDVLRSED